MAHPHAAQLDEDVHIGRLHRWAEIRRLDLAYLRPGPIPGRPWPRARDAVARHLAPAAAIGGAAAVIAVALVAWSPWFSPSAAGAVPVALAAAWSRRLLPLLAAATSLLAAGVALSVLRPLAPVPLEVSGAVVVLTAAAAVLAGTVVLVLVRSPLVWWVRRHLPPET
jgi:hypothetical protein